MYALLLATALHTTGPALRPGSYGPDVGRLQRRLKQLHFTPGKVNNLYDQDTGTALRAFQKAEGIRPSKVVRAATWRALEHPRPLRPLKPHGGRSRIEVDLRRQLIFVYQKNRVVLAGVVSSGSGRHYCSAGHCGVAVTPSGDFRIIKIVPRWQHAPLGWMYRPLYFHGGNAIHGSLSVPAHPASHGCVRVPMNFAQRLRGLVKTGEHVYVRR